MIEKDITNRGPKKRDPMCFELQHAILVPKGTILRQEAGKPDIFTCPVSGGVFTVTTVDAMIRTDTYKRVIA